MNRKSTAEPLLYLRFFVRTARISRISVPGLVGALLLCCSALLPPAASAAGELLGNSISGGTKAVSGVVDRLRVEVDEDSLYFVAAEEIGEPFGLSPGDTLTRIQNAQIQLSRGDQAVAYLPVPDGLLFFGRQVRDNIYTRREVYQIALGTGIHMPLVSGGAAVPGNTQVNALIHLEEDLFAATEVAGNAELDYWHWWTLTAADPEREVASIALPVPGLVAGSSARMTVHFRGAVSSPVELEHHAVLEIDGTPIGEAFFDGVEDHTATFDIPAGVLEEGSGGGRGVSSLRVEARLQPGVTASSFYLDSIDLEVQRQALAIDGELYAAFDMLSEVTAGGFAGAELIALDVSDPDQPALIQDALVSTSGPPAITFGRPAAAEHFLAADLSDVHIPELIADPASDWRHTANGASYLVIATDSLLQPAQRLADLRLADFPSTAVVRLQDIMDEWAAGRFHPPAIQEFLSHAASQWSAPPSHVALMGVGSFDFRGLMGPLGDPLPPLMVATSYGLSAADGAFADFDGDSKPDIALGRIPAVTVAEADSYIDQLVAYESSGLDWRLRELLLADDGAGFSAEAQAVASGLPQEIQHEVATLNQMTAAELQERLLIHLSEGVGQVSWSGEGSEESLAAEGVLSMSDLAAMSHSEQPIFSLISGTVGRFELPDSRSLAEELLLSPNGGIAVVATTGLAHSQDGFEANRIWHQELYTSDLETVGEVFQRTIRRFVDQIVTESDPRSLVLMADPGLRVGVSGHVGPLIFSDGFESGGLARWTGEP